MGSKMIGVYIFPISLGLVHLFAGALMFYKNTQMEHRMIFAYLVRALISVAMVIMTIYTFNAVSDYQIAIVRLLVVGGIFIVLLPLLAIMLGFDIRNIISKITKKIGTSNE